MTNLTVLYIVLGAIIALMMVFFQYFYKEKKSKYHLILAILRFISVFSILLLFINPKIKSKQQINIQPKLNVLIDNSSSISFANLQDSVNDLITKIKYDNKLNDKFNINFYAFSNDLYPKDSLNFQEPETNILKSLQTLQTLNSNEVSPTILVTDGNQTYGSSYQHFKPNKEIFPIVVGDTTKYEDIFISQVNTNSYTNLNNKFPVEILVQYQGERPINTSLEITKNKKVIDRRAIRLSKNNNSEIIQLHLNADEVGTFNYLCTLTPLYNEKNKKNNIRNFSIEVIDEQAKILVLSDINHPDLGMIKRSLETNKQRKVILEDNLDKSIQYKEYQLVILYQPNNKFNNIIGGILDSKVNFFIITGTSTNWNFLNSVQPYFTKKAITRTEDYAPSFNSSFDEFIIEDFGFLQFPPVHDYFGDISFAVPYKSILFQRIADFETETPLLAIFSDDQVKKAALFGENIWKWRMFSKIEHSDFNDFDDFFGKLIQYLTSNKQMSRLDIDYEPFTYSNTNVVIKAQYFDANYFFDDSVTLILTLNNTTTGISKKIPFSLRSNNFDVRINDLTPGNYTFTVSVEKSGITRIGSFTILNYNIEQQLTRANNNHLQSLAENSGGELYHLNNTDRLFSKLISDNRFSVRQKSLEKVVSLIEWKWLLFIVAISLAIEWFIRKYKGLI